jgi:hypothetical protein
MVDKLEFCRFSGIIFGDILNSARQVRLAAR